MEALKVLWKLTQKKGKVMYELMEKMGISIAKFPEGLNTEISENMGNLSGGEIQKLSLIRALLQDKKYIF